MTEQKAKANEPKPNRLRTVYKSEGRTININPAKDHVAAALDGGWFLTEAEAEAEGKKPEAEAEGKKPVDKPKI